MKIFARGQSPDGTVKFWNRYPHNFNLMLPFAGDDCWLASYHHATLPITIAVSWHNWTLYLWANRNGRTLFTAEI